MEDGIEGCLSTGSEGAHKERRTDTVVPRDLPPFVCNSSAGDRRQPAGSNTVQVPS